MSQWLTLVGKEVLEMRRSYKWIWMPLTFILLGVQEPLGSYYMPQIIDSLGGLPEGAKIEIPIPSAAEVMASGISQFNTLGFLIIILISMSLVAGERKSGTAEMILVKPVSHASFITAKWAGALLLVWASLLIGFFATWYYTGVLFEWVALENIFGALLLEGLWLTFVLTTAVFFSSLFLVSGAAGFAAAACLIILSMVSGWLSHLLEWSPAQLPDYAGIFLKEGGFPQYSIMASVLTLVLALLLLVAAIIVFRKKEAAA